MADRIVYGCAETGTYRTTSPVPHVDLSGTAAQGYGIQQTFVAVLNDRQTCTVTVRQGESVWAVYGGAVFTIGLPNSLDLSGATLLESAGTIGNGNTVTVLGLAPHLGQFPSVYTPAITANQLVLNLNTERDTYHRISLNSNIQTDPAGITASNVPSGGVIRIFVEMTRTSDSYDCPELAWGGLGTVIFDTDYYVYPIAANTPTIFTLLSVDGGVNWRARCNAPVLGNTVMAVTALPGTPDPDVVYLVYEA